METPGYTVETLVSFSAPNLIYSSIIAIMTDSETAVVATTQNKLRILPLGVAVLCLGILIGMRMGEQKKYGIPEHPYPWMVMPDKPKPCGCTDKTEQTENPPQPTYTPPEYDFKVDPDAT